MSPETVIDVVGATPLVRLEHLVPHNGSEVWVKLEGNNPAGSIKDRAARSMIEEAEKRGDIKPGDALVEATSGNTGIALAMIAALKGYRMKIILPANSTAERCAAIQAYGAELILSPAEKGMEGARDLANAMAQRGEGWQLDQFNNPDNPLAHYRTTGPEIWTQTAGRVTHFVSAMGTTGTITGTSRFLKEKIPMYVWWVCSRQKEAAFPVFAAGRRSIGLEFTARNSLMKHSIFCKRCGRYRSSSGSP